MRSLAGIAMSWKTICVVTLGLVLAGCGAKSQNILAPPGGGAVQDYQGTASVGDFISITIDHDAHTISYSNHSNGTSGVATYTVAADGSYLITDPSGNLVTAYEIPGYALVLEARKAGPAGDTPALVFAILREPIHKADLAGAHYNYMQFRTSSGGMELGAVAVDGLGSISTEGYWPYGGASGQTSFNGGTFSTDLIQEDSTGDYLTLLEPGETIPTRIFKTAGGFLAVDTQNGSIICLGQQASKDFSPAWAGTYAAILYRKDNAQTGVGNVETGDVSIDRGTITLNSAGNVTVTNAAGAEIVNTALVPVADNPALVGPGMLQNTCPGLFSFTIDNPNGREEVFVVFINNALLFSSFAYDPSSIMSGSLYRYFYGVGLRR